jgi:hypothetical protein
MKEGGTIMALPLGIRLNNPLNIRKTDLRWRGEVESGRRDFEAFATLADGLRAGAKLLLNYQLRHHRRTVAAIVDRFAPAGDGNPTAAYAEFVARQLGVGPTATLDLTDPATLTSLLRALIRFEQGGNFVTLEQIAGAVRQAITEAAAPTRAA